MELDPKLFKRVWVINNRDWLLNEMAYYREFKKYLKGNKIVIWKFGNNQATTKIDV